MEIKNVTLFFIGITISILGIFVIIFDYPQIQYLENKKLDPDSNYRLDIQDMNIHQRLILEITIGIGILGLGMILLTVSFLKKFENRFS